MNMEKSSIILKVSKILESFIPLFPKLSKDQEKQIVAYINNPNIKELIIGIESLSQNVAFYTSKREVENGNFDKALILVKTESSLDQSYEDILDTFWVVGCSRKSLGNNVLSPIFEFNINNYENKLIHEDLNKADENIEGLTLKASKKEEIDFRQTFIYVCKIYNYENNYNEETNNCITKLKNIFHHLSKQKEPSYIREEIVEIYDFLIDVCPKHKGDFMDVFITATNYQLFNILNTLFEFKNIWVISEAEFDNFLKIVVTFLNTWMTNYGGLVDILATNGNKVKKNEIFMAIQKDIEANIDEVKQTRDLFKFFKQNLDENSILSPSEFQSFNTFDIFYYDKRSLLNATHLQETLLNGHNEFRHIMNKYLEHIKDAIFKCVDEFVQASIPYIKQNNYQDQTKLLLKYEIFFINKYVSYHLVNNTHLISILNTYSSNFYNSIISPYERAVKDFQKHEGVDYDLFLKLMKMLDNDILIMEKIKIILEIYIHNKSENIKNVDQALVYLVKQRSEIVSKMKELLLNIHFYNPETKFDPENKIYKPIFEDAEDKRLCLSYHPEFFKFTRFMKEQYSNNGLDLNQYEDISNDFISNLYESGLNYLSRAEEFNKLALIFNELLNSIVKTRGKTMIIEELSKLIDYINQNCPKWNSNEDEVEHFKHNFEKKIKSASNHVDELTAIDEKISHHFQILKEMNIYIHHRVIKEHYQCIRSLIKSTRCESVYALDKWKKGIEQEFLEYVENNYKTCNYNSYFVNRKISLEVFYRNNKIHFSPDIEKLTRNLDSKILDIKELPMKYCSMLECDDLILTYKDFLIKNRNMEIEDKVKYVFVDILKKLDDIKEILMDIIHPIQIYNFHIDEMEERKDWENFYKDYDNKLLECISKIKEEYIIGNEIVIITKRFKEDLTMDKKNYVNKITDHFEVQINKEILLLKTKLLSHEKCLKSPIIEGEDLEVFDDMIFDGIEESQISLDLDKLCHKKELYEMVSFKVIHQWEDLINVWKGLQIQVLQTSHNFSQRKNMMKLNAKKMLEALDGDYTNICNIWQNTIHNIFNNNYKVDITGTYKLFFDDIAKLDVFQNKWKTFNSKFNEAINQYSLTRFVPNHDTQIWINKVKEFTEQLLVLNPILNISHHLIDITLIQIPNVRNFADDLKKIIGEWESIKLSNVLEPSHYSYSLNLYINDYMGTIANLTPFFDYVEEEYITKIYPHLLDIMDQKINYEYEDEMEKLNFSTILININKLLARKEDLMNLLIQCTSAIKAVNTLKDFSIWASITTLKYNKHLMYSGIEIRYVENWDELLKQVIDKQHILQTLKTIKHLEKFNFAYNPLMKWNDCLENVDCIIHQSKIIHGYWISLEPLMSKKVFEQEKTYNLFKVTQNNWINILNAYEKTPYLIQSLLSDSFYKAHGIESYTTIQDKFNSIIHNYETISQNLAIFLEEKRKMISLFYFLSNNDLLEFLSNPANPLYINNYIPKIYEGIESFVLDVHDYAITHVVTDLGERIRLTNTVNCLQDPMVWIKNLSHSITNSLKWMLVNYYDKLNNLITCGDMNALKQMLEIINVVPFQIISLICHIEFTKLCEVAIQSNAMTKLLKSLNECFDIYLCYMKDSLSKNYVQNGLSQSMNKKIQAIMREEIYFIAIATNLISSSIKDINSWEWKKHLRYYLYSTQKTDWNVSLAIWNYKLNYFFEIQEFIMPLIYTNLTEKCFLISSYAVANKCGSNPYGKAGTGKTESIKNFGRLCGKRVIVFNCNKSLDWDSTQRLIDGVSKCSYWGCFDEFNRLDMELMSIISNYVSKSIISAKEDSQYETFFITLNPKSNCYLDRSATPSITRNIFIPIAMRNPDIEQIINALLKLFPATTINSRTEAKKLIFVMAFLKNTLSDQKFYDWSLRSFLLIMNICKNDAIQMLQHQSICNKDKCKSINLAKLFDFTCYDAFKVAFYSRLISTWDKYVMSYTLGHFYEINIDNSLHNFKKSSSSLSDESSEEILFDMFEKEAMILVPEIAKSYLDWCVEKCKELLLQLQNRLGVILYGHSRTGKSLIIKIMIQALNKYNNQMKLSLSNDYNYYIINPNSLSTNQLYGYMDMEHKTWNDGIFTNIARKALNKNFGTLIVFEGSLLPEWIETLNSILDDNQSLILASGEILNFKQNGETTPFLKYSTNIIFETDNITRISPATVSRLGMVCFEESKEKFKQECSLLPTFKEENEMNKDIFLFIDRLIKINDFFVPLNISSCINLLTMTDIVYREKYLNGETDNYDGILSILYNWIKCNLLSLLPSYYAQNFNTRLWDLVISSNMENDIQNVKYLLKNKDESNITTYSTLFGNTSFVNISMILAQQIIRSNVIKHYLLIIYSDGNMISNFFLNDILKTKDITDILYIDKITDNFNETFINMLMSHCIVIPSDQGYDLKPFDGKLAIVFNNIQNYSKSKLDYINQIIYQLLEYGGFYSDLNKWIQLKSTLYIGTFFKKYDQIKKLFDNPISILSQRILSRTLCISMMDRNITQNSYENIIIGIVDGAILNSILKDIFLSDNDKKIFYNFWIESLEEIWLIYQKYERSPNSKFDILLEIISTTLDNTLILIENLQSKEMDKWIIIKMLLNIYIRNLKRYFFKDQLIELKQTISNIIIKNWKALNWDGLDIYLFKDKSNQITSFNQSHHIQEIEQNDCKQFIQNLDINISNFDVSYENFADYLGLLSSFSPFIIFIKGGEVDIRDCLISVSNFLRYKVIAIPLSYQLAKAFIFDEIKKAISYVLTENNHVVIILEPIHFKVIEDLDFFINNIICYGDISSFHGTSLTKLYDIRNENVIKDERYEKTLSTRTNLHIIILWDFETGFEFINNIRLQFPPLYRYLSVVVSPMWQREDYKKVLYSYYNMSNKEDFNKNFSKKYLDVDTVWTLIQSHIFNEDKNLEISINPELFKLFIYTFTRLFTNTNLVMENESKTLMTGIESLKSFKDTINKIKAESSEKYHHYLSKQDLAKDIVNKIENNVEEENVRKKQLLELKSKEEMQMNELEKQKEICAIQIQEIMPLVMEAKSSVSTINEDDLYEIRSLRAPPIVIRDILEGVFKLLGIYDTSWNNIKSYLSKKKFKEEILNFDVRMIKDQSRKIVEALLDQRKESFNQRNALRASTVAAPLAMWVKANLKYAQVLQKVIPIEKKLKCLEMSLENNKKHIMSFEQAFQTNEEIIANNKIEYEKISFEIANTKREISNEEKKVEEMTMASGLLEGELINWNKRLHSNEHEMMNLHTNCFLATLLLFKSDSKGSLGSINMQLANYKLPSKVLKKMLNIYHKNKEIGPQFSFVPKFESATHMDTTFKLEMTPMIPLIIDAEGLLLEQYRYAALTNPSVNLIDIKDPNLMLTFDILKSSDTCMIIYGIVDVTSTIVESIIDIYRDKSISGLKTLNYTTGLQPSNIIFISSNKNLARFPPLNNFVIVINFSYTKLDIEMNVINIILSVMSPVKYNIDITDKDELLFNVEVLESDMLKVIINYEYDSGDKGILLTSLRQLKSKADAMRQDIEKAKERDNLMSSIASEYKEVIDISAHAYFMIKKLKEIIHVYDISHKNIMIALSTILQKNMVYMKNNNKSDIRRQILIDVYNTFKPSIFPRDYLTFAIILCYNPNDTKDGDTWHTMLNSIMCNKISIRERIDSRNKANLSLKNNNSNNKEIREEATKDRNRHSDATIYKNDGNVIKPFLNLNNPNFSALSELIGFNYDTPCKCLNEKLNEINNPLPIIIYTLRNNVSNPCLELSNIFFDLFGPLAKIESYPLIPNITIHNPISIQIQMSTHENNVNIIKDITSYINLPVWITLTNYELVNEELSYNILEMHKSKVLNQQFKLFLITEIDNDINFQPDCKKYLPLQCLKFNRIAYDDRDYDIKTLALILLKYFRNKIISSNTNTDTHNKLPTLKYVLAIIIVHVCLVHRSKFRYAWTGRYQFSMYDFQNASQSLINIFEIDSPNKVSNIKETLKKIIYGNQIESQYDKHILAIYIRQIFEFSEKIKVPESNDLNSWHENFKDLEKSLILHIKKIWNAQFSWLPLNVTKSIDLCRWDILKKHLTTLNLYKNDYALENTNNLEYILRLWENLNKNVKLSDYKYDSNKNSNILTIYLLEEYKFTSNLINIIHSNLGIIRKVCKKFKNKSSTILSPKFKEIYDSIEKNEVCTSWILSGNISVSQPCDIFFNQLFSKAEILKQYITWIHTKNSLFESNDIELAWMRQPATFLYIYKLYYCERFSLNSTNTEYFLITKQTSSKECLNVVNAFITQNFRVIQNSNGFMDIKKCETETSLTTIIPTLKLLVKEINPDIRENEPIKIPVYKYTIDSGDDYFNNLDTIMCIYLDCDEKDNYEWLYFCNPALLLHHFGT